MSKPIITVIVPIYNVEKYLRQCLDSLINQSFSELEILCINDGSTDASLDILKEYQMLSSKIKIINKKNGGYGSAINYGLKNANGDYIGIVEPDDFIVYNMYEELYQMVLKYGNLDIIKAGYWDYFDNETEATTKLQLGLSLPNESIFNIYDHPELLRIHPSVWSCIYRKSFLFINKIHMIEAKGAGWVDNPFFFETMCQAKTICWVNKPVYYYRQSNYNSSSNLKDCSIPLSRLNEMFDFLEKKHITDVRIHIELYKRTILYISKIENNPNYNKKNQQETYRLLKRLNPQIISKLTANEVKIYEHNKNKPYAIQCYVKNIKDSYSNTILYKIVRKIWRGFKYFRVNGMIMTYRRIVQEVCPQQIIKMPPKTSVRVLFIASDNNRTSGAFLSMVTLNTILREKYNVDTFVVLPNIGNGDKLLQENKIPYALVESKDWVIPLGLEKNQKFKEELKQKKKINKKAIRVIQKSIQDNKVDLVHINTTYSYVGAIAAIKTKTPLVWHIREFLEEDQSNTLWDREKGNRLISQANKVIAISQSIYKKYSNIVPHEKLICILNGIDASKFYKPNKQILQNDIVRFIFIGGFEYYKGHIEFAEACVKLYQMAICNFEIWFIGTGKQEVRARVEKIFNEAGLNNRVTYWGYKNNVYDYLEQTDIAFTCSKSEAFGRTTVEAMLSGNLVIGADSAGTQELIQDNKTGLLYSQGDPDDLCSKIIFAIKQQEHSKLLAAQGRKYMFENMTAEINAKNIYQIYQSLI